MIRIQHRVNAMDQLLQTETGYGVEIDIRNHGEELFVIHDPFSAKAVFFSEWLMAYDHQFLIVNVKEEGLEPKLLKLLCHFKIKNFFILDESIPYIRKYALEGVANFALRVSEFESVETALALSHHLKSHGRRVDWIWMDTFTGAPLLVESVEKLRGAGFKLCQVSPELHHVNDPESWESRISAFHDLNGGSYSPDMVCTKRPDLW